MCSSSFLKNDSGMSSGKQTSSWSVLFISARIRLSTFPISFQPYGRQMFIPLMGYRLSQRSASSTISLYHWLKSSLFLVFVSGIDYPLGKPNWGDILKSSGVLESSGFFCFDTKICGSTSSASFS